MWLDFRQVQYFYVDNPFGRSWKIQPSFSLPKVANVNVSVKKKLTADIYTTMYHVALKNI